MPAPRTRAALLAAAALIAGASACHRSSPSAARDGGPSPDAGGDAGRDAGPGLPDAGGAGADAGDAGADGGSDAGGDAGADAGSDAGPPVITKLPLLPAMSNVVAVAGDDSVAITFDPVDGALDYRVYPLPDDADISISDGGVVTVQNATYRCAGNRETPAPNVEQTINTGSWVTTEVDQDEIGGYLRTLAGATLGYVYTQPGAGLVPVYVLGESDPNADDGCYFARWEASRAKRYTTSASERQQLLADEARDDGVQFYVPADAGPGTTQLYVDEDGVGTPSRDRYYFAAGPEAAVHPDKAPAFAVLSAQAPGTQPLMRVFYQNNCGWSHDELAVGQERFNRIYQQGDKLPLWSLLWTGLTGPTTLVVEALDKGCPYQGHLAAAPVEQVTAYYGTLPLIHQPFQTLEQVRAASPTGEVFINGQAGTPWIWDALGPDGGNPNAPSGTGTPLPNAIARSFVKVSPVPHAPMDFFANFAPDAGAETFTTVPCGVAGGDCYATWRQQSPTFDQMFIDVEYDLDAGSGVFAAGPVLGELWVTYADVGSDTNGKYRLTANQHATMDSATFLHATMEVDAFSTTRRYPQLIISDQDAPVQYNLAQGHSLIIQPRGEDTEWFDFPVDYQLEICNLRTWDVNNQCPLYDLYHLLGADGGVAALAPNDEVGEHASVDHRVLFDVYASTQRVYLFLDGAPYACANLPAVGPPQAGPVTVTWGDVLYHSAVDHTFAFHADQLQIETRRHFDNLGFSSGVPAPAWDETRLPCVAAITP